MADFGLRGDGGGALPYKDIKDLFVPPKPDTVTLADDEMAASQSVLNMYDPKNPDIGLFNVVDGELVRVAGSELVIYAFLRGSNIDDLYEEQRAKVLYVPPKVVYGHYEPRAIEENLSEFGIELTNDQMFTFNKQTVERSLGRSMIPGDVIKPKFQNLYYEVFEVQEDSFEAYGVFHLTCSARILRDAENLIKENTIPEDQLPAGGTIAWS